MKLILESPYKELYDNAKVYINNKTKRAIVRMHSKKTKESLTTTYSRYLISVAENRFLSDNEHVDHKDEDKTNDDPNNLQILSPAENTRKSLVAHGIVAKMDILVCRTCNEDFIRNRKYQKYNLDGSCKDVFCSRDCARKFYKAEMETKICPQCDKEFSRPKWWFCNQEKRGVMNPCCSISCAGKLHKPLKTQDAVCPQCSTIFTKPEWYFRQKKKAGVKNFCCSKSCVVKFYQLHPELISKK